MRRSLEIVGRQTADDAGERLVRKRREPHDAVLALFRQPDAALGNFGGDDGRALGRVGEQFRIHAGLKQLPFQRRQGAFGVVDVGQGFMFVFLALGRGLEVIGLGCRQVFFRIGAGLYQFLQTVADILLGLKVSAASFRMSSSCFS